MGVRNIIDGFFERRAAYAAYEVGQALAQERIDPVNVTARDLENLLSRHHIHLKYEDQKDLMVLMARDGYIDYYTDDPNADGSTLRERSGC